jgi:phosphoribosylformylglycinamidine synthase
VSADKADEIIDSIDVDAAIIGEVKGDSLKINKEDENIVDLAVKDLDDAYHGVIEKYMA